MHLTRIKKASKSFNDTARAAENYIRWTAVAEETWRQTGICL
jgi:hypothetical protein